MTTLCIKDFTLSEFLQSALRSVTRASQAVEILCEGEAHQSPEERNGGDMATGSGLGHKELHHTLPDLGADLEAVRVSELLYKRRYYGDTHDILSFFLTTT